jgi:uncharacterized protein YbjT (DUF2867 family)
VSHQFQAPAALSLPIRYELVGPQSQSGQRGEEKIFDATGTRILTLWLNSPRAIAVLIALSGLSKQWNIIILKYRRA